MILKDYFKIAWQYLKSKKLRTFLTVVGVSISLILIFTLLILGSSLKNSIEEQFNKISPQTVFVLAKTSGGIFQSSFVKQLKKDDCKYIENNPLVDICTYLYTKFVTIEIANEKMFTSILVTNNNFYSNINKFGYTVAEGKVPKKGEALVGYLYSTDKIIKEPLKIGDTIVIDGKKFKIVGFLEELGNPQDDMNIYLHEDDFKIDRVNILQFLIKDLEEVEKIKDQFNKKKNGNFEFLTTEALLEQTKDLLNIINYAIIAIASISLIVGSLGISNTLITSVYERKRDIGIMKAMGAKNSDIFKMIMIETIIIMFISIIIGMSLGYLIGYSATLIFNNLGYKLRLIVTFQDIILTLSFALFFGFVSAYIPAKMATKLDPIEAIRK
ncbi:MAG: FtsX-like permease family protein [Candidatus Woesearchaeota archaeon]